MPNYHKNNFQLDSTPRSFSGHNNSQNSHNSNNSPNNLHQSLFVPKNMHSQSIFQNPIIIPKPKKKISRNEDFGILRVFERQNQIMANLSRDIQMHPQEQIT